MAEPARVYLAEHHPETDAPGIIIATPWKEEFTAELKQGVGPGMRRYIPHTKSWWVADEAAEYARDLVAHHFGGYVLMDEDGEEEVWDRRGPVASQGRLL